MTNLETLKYDPKWLEFGFLTDDELKSQREEFDKGRDLNTEHYRYKKFIDVINKKSKFSDREINCFLELVELDEDQVMSSSALADLIKSKKLTNYQYLKVKHVFLSYGDWANKVVERIEKPYELTFNKEFCDLLEIKISNLLFNSNIASWKGFWCDGIEVIEVSKKAINNKRQLETRIWIGKDGQNEYRLILKFGKYALRRFVKGTKMIDCIPENNIEDWMRINESQKIVEIQLK